MMNLRGTANVEEVAVGTVIANGGVVEAVSDDQREEAGAENENAKEIAVSVIGVIVVNVSNGREAVAGIDIEDVLQNHPRRGSQEEEEAAVGQKIGDDPGLHPG